MKVICSIHYYIELEISRFLTYVLFQNVIVCRQVSRWHVHSTQPYMEYEQRLCTGFDFPDKCWMSHPCWAVNEINESVDIASTLCNIDGEGTTRISLQKDSFYQNNINTWLL